jgi:Tol biopolymer transport system component
MKKEKVLIQDLFELKFIRSVRIKPDDNKFLYIVERMDKKDDKYYSKIYEYDFKSKESKQLVHKKGKYFNVNYSPNGKWISFISDRDKKMKLYIMPSDGGEADEIEFKEFYLSNYLWGKDENNLLLTLTKKSKDEKDLEKAKKPEKNSTIYIRYCEGKDR